MRYRGQGKIPEGLMPTARLSERQTLPFAEEMPQSGRRDKSCYSLPPPPSQYAAGDPKNLLTSTTGLLDLVHRPGL
jgi:hypothetical protein